MNLKWIANKFLFSNVTPLIIRGRTHILQADDIPELPADLNPRTVPIAIEQIEMSTPWRLLLSLFSTGRRYFIKALALNLAGTAASLTGPSLVYLFVHRLSAGLTTHADLQMAVLLAIALGVSSFASGLAMQHYFHVMLQTYQIFSNALNKLIFQHSLVLSIEARQKTAVGDIVNYMSSDTDAIANIGMFTGELLISVVSIVGATALLFYYIGWSTLVAVVILALLAPLTKKIARDFSRLEYQMMEFRDQRVSRMSQILNAIRVIKYFAWEESARDEVTRVRNQELTSRRELAHSEIYATLSYVAVSTLVLFATLLVHVLRGRTLDAATAFACLSLFNLLDEPFGNLSRIISNGVNALVSARRLIAFLNQPQISHHKRPNVSSDDEVAPTIECVQLSVQFAGQNRAALQAIDFKVEPGESVAVVGPVGAGKTTLLYTLLGEYPHEQIRYLGRHGETIWPRLAFVPQEAYILNHSLRDNMIFGAQPEPDEAAIQKALYLACMEQDVAQLPAGLQTEIGERGVNLSGGQKQRVSLARAILHRPKLVLLDDPLSAVDPRTEALLLQRLIFGEWHDLTRVVATHRLDSLHQFDRVAFLQDGQLKGFAPFQELLAVNDEFKNFYAEHLKHTQDETTQALHRATQSINSTQTEIVEVQTESRITQDEDRESGAVRGSIYRQYIRALGGSSPRQRPWVLAALLAGTLIVTALPLLQKWWLAQSTSAAAGPLPLSVILVYGGLGLITLVAILLNRRLWLERGIAAGRDMHTQMLDSVLAAPLRFFDATPMGRILQRFSRDVESVDIQLQWSFEETFRCGVFVVTSLILIVAVVPTMIVAIVPILYLYYRVQADYRRPAREAKRLDSLSRSPRYAFFKETLHGLVVIRGFQKSAWFLENFYRTLEYNQRMFRGHYMLNRWFSTRIPLLGGLIASSTGIAMTWLAYRNQLSPGLAGLITMYALALWHYLNWAVRVFAEVEARMTSVERIRYFSNLESERETILPVTTNLASEWPQQGAIEFRHVQARYATHLPWILKDVSFRIEPCTRVGIVGRTGAGKSTLFQTLFRCIEIEGGEILLDGISIGSVPLPRLRQSLAIIPQDPVLFMGTLRDNLDCYHEYTDDEIEFALQQAHLHTFVYSLPQKLTTAVHEDGRNFSQGQRQLLCLARALLCRAKVIVMDEATASVDVQTDARVQTVIRQACQNATLLVIAHRLTTVADCDQILEVRDGHVYQIRGAETPADTTLQNYQRKESCV